MAKRLPKAEITRVKQRNGYIFDYGIKLNIKGFNLKCILVQPSVTLSLNTLRDRYIYTINKLKKENAIKYINEELENGFLISDDLKIVND